MIFFLKKKEILCYNHLKKNIQLILSMYTKAILLSSMQLFIKKRDKTSLYTFEKISSTSEKYSFSFIYFFIYFFYLFILRIILENKKNTYFFIRTFEMKKRPMFFPMFFYKCVLLASVINNFCSF